MIGKLTNIAPPTSPDRPTMPNAEDGVKLALATPLQFAPGTKYDYSNVGYSLAAAIVELVSGEPLPGAVP